MENFKKLLLPMGLIALVLVVFSFTNHKKTNEEKCTVKIVKIINGVQTEVDSTFDCSEEMTWIHEGIDGSTIHNMIKVMMTEGDSESFVFDFKFDENDEEGAKMMKFIGDDGKEVEMNFDFSSDGNGKIMINGKEIEIAMDNLHKHMEKIHDKMENIELIVESDKESGEQKTVKIIKKQDEEGNTTVQKWVNGEEVEFDEKDLQGNHKMMFISDDGKTTSNHEMKIEVSVEGEKGKEKQHIIIISNISKANKKELEKEAPKVAANLNKKELNVNKLKFSPNPNNGKFDLQFKLDDTNPVTVNVFDLQGKEVYSETINNFTGKYANNIDISENGKGTYILQIIQKNKAKTSKVVIK